MAESGGERRVVSVALVDIVDSTAIGEMLGPERSKFLFDEVVRLLASEVKRFGGTVAEFTGDGLYALFGAPSAHEDDAERAVRAALAMQSAVAGYARDVAEAYGVELAARIANENYARRTKSLPQRPGTRSTRPRLPCQVVPRLGLHPLAPSSSASSGESRSR